MANSIYQVNRNINKSIVFKGIKAQYLSWLAIGMFVSLLIFGILYAMGLNTYLCMLFAFSMISGVVIKTMQLSKKYGQHGLSKLRAKQNIPTHIRNRSRTIFFKR